MADIIRQRSLRVVNRLNKWPTNGLFTVRSKTCRGTNRQWFNVSVNDISMIIGNVFEQVDFYSLSFTINARINYDDRSSPYINLSIDLMSAESMPIESIERHELDDFLRHKINQALLVSDVISFKISCHVKGWFWLP